MKTGGRWVALVARMVASIVTLASIAGLSTRPSMAQDTTSGHSATRVNATMANLRCHRGFCASIFADNLSRHSAACCWH
jgi:hypothetical protein